MIPRLGLALGLLVTTCAGANAPAHRNLGLLPRRRRWTGDEDRRQARRGLRKDHPDVQVKPIYTGSYVETSCYGPRSDGRQSSSGRQRARPSPDASSSTTEGSRDRVKQICYRAVADTRRTRPSAGGRRQQFLQPLVLWFQILALHPVRPALEWCLLCSSADARRPRGWVGMNLSEYLLITHGVANRLDDLRRTLAEPDEPDGPQVDRAYDDRAGQPAVKIR
jgi:hypothetical protein